MPLSKKHARFVAEYLKDLNAAQAAIRCGYSEKTARQQGSRLLTNADIAQAVADQTAKQLVSSELTAVGTKEAIRRVVEADIRVLFDEHGNVKPIHLMTRDEAAQIAGFEVIKRNLTAGDGHTDVILKVKLKDQRGFVEMAAKHFGLLSDKVEHSGVFRVIHELAE